MSKRSSPRGGRKSRGSTKALNTPPSTQEGANGGAHRVAAGPGGAKPSNGASNGSGGDQFNLATNILKDAPEVRDELIARYRKLIAEGRYHPDLEGVAERMIREGLLKDV